MIGSRFVALFFDLSHKAWLKDMLHDHGFDFRRIGQWNRNSGVAINSQDDRNGNIGPVSSAGAGRNHDEIGRASCRESVCQYVSISVVAVLVKTKTNKLSSKE